MPEPLAPGHEIRCPHCRRWHIIEPYHLKEGTAYTLDMLFWHCGELRYYAGQIGGTPRYPVRTESRTPTNARRC